MVRQTGTNICHTLMVASDHILECSSKRILSERLRSLRQLLGHTKCGYVFFCAVIICEIE